MQGDDVTLLRRSTVAGYFLDDTAIRSPLLPRLRQRLVLPWAVRHQTDRKLPLQADQQLQSHFHLFRSQVPLVAVVWPDHTQPQLRGATRLPAATLFYLIFVSLKTPSRILSLRRWLTAYSQGHLLDNSTIVSFATSIAPLFGNLVQIPITSAAKRQQSWLFMPRSSCSTGPGRATKHLCGNMPYLFGVNDGQSYNGSLCLHLSHQRSV